MEMAKLPKMAAHEAAVNETAPLVARDLEPWRAVLAVAHWLDELGVNGLYQRMCDLARSYQTERVELETVNLTGLVVSALIALLAPSAPLPPSAPFDRDTPQTIGASEVTAKINEIANEDELTDGDSAFTNERRVGKVLSTLRLRHARRIDKKDKRKRIITLSQLDDIARSYGHPSIFHEAPIPTNGGNGGNGANGGSPPEKREAPGPWPAKPPPLVDRPLLEPSSSANPHSRLPHRHTAPHTDQAHLTPQSLCQNAQHTPAQIPLLSSLHLIQQFNRCLISPMLQFLPHRIPYLV